jgi:protein phosphatase methylesterase 1
MSEKTMSDLQRRWAKAKLNAAMPVFNELDEEGTGTGDESDSDVTTRSLSYSATSETSDAVPSFPDDDSSSASSSSVSSTGTVIPSPARALFARPLGYPLLPQ